MLALISVSIKIQHSNCETGKNKKFLSVTQGVPKSCFLDVTEYGNNSSFPLALLQVVWMKVLSNWSPIRSGQFVYTIYIILLVDILLVKPGKPEFDTQFDH